MKTVQQVLHAKSGPVLSVRPDTTVFDALVLIDEIELHLHPRWQRSVIPNLEKTFPNCQFIVTTHSPQVLDSVYSYERVILTNEGA